MTVSESSLKPEASAPEEWGTIHPERDGASRNGVSARSSHGHPTK